MGGCGWAPDPVCSASPEKADGRDQGEAQTRSEGRGKERSPLEGPQAGRRGLHPDQGPGREVAMSTAGKGRQTDMLGTGDGAGAPQTAHVGPTSHLCESRGPGGDGAVLGEGRGQRANQQGGPQDRGRCPGVSRGTARRLAVRRTRETLRTQAASTGAWAWGGGVGDQEGLSVTGTRSTATETLPGGAGAEGPGLRRSSFQQLGSLLWAGRRVP